LKELEGQAVGFVIEVFWAIVMVGVPIAAFTLAIIWWALQHGHLQETLDTGALRGEIKAMSKKNKAKKGRSDLHPIQKKWAKFGGGFYGIVAFFTYIVVEVYEIITVISGFGGFIDFLRALDIGVIIGMLVDALMNFITAMVWPFYWMQRIETDQTWVWFVVAYAGYWLGLRLAQHFYRRRSVARG
jgi:hypothetical protein